jgi:hypothetical protein
MTVQGNPASFARWKMSINESRSLAPNTTLVPWQSLRYSTARSGYSFRHKSYVSRKACPVCAAILPGDIHKSSRTTAYKRNVLSSVENYVIFKTSYSWECFMARCSGSGDSVRPCLSTPVKLQFAQFAQFVANHFSGQSTLVSMLHTFHIPHLLTTRPTVFSSMNFRVWIVLPATSPIFPHLNALMTTRFIAHVVFSVVVYLLSTVEPHQLDHAVSTDWSNLTAHQQKEKRRTSSIPSILH